jgi:AcrR family transcriptional regulator
MTAPQIESDWDRKRAAILTAAGEVFAERGFKGGTTKEIAERSGLSQPSIYHYVGSKNDLLLEIVREVDAYGARIFDRLKEAGDSPVEKLRLIIHAQLELALESPSLYEVYWHEQRSLPAELAGELTKGRSGYIRRVDRITRECQAAGALPANHSSRVLTEGILGMLHVATRWYRPGGKYEPSEIADAFCDLVGLAPAAAAKIKAPPARKRSASRAA